LASVVQTILLFLLLIVSASATADERIIPSPNKQFCLVLAGPEGGNDSFRSMAIQNRLHEILFSSEGHHLSEQVSDVPFSAAHILWSPDSEAVAVVVGYPKYMLTYVFVRDGEKFVSVAVSDVTEGEDNPNVFPVKWLKGRRLILDISGPYAGKADNGHYKGTATIRVRTKPPACEILYHHLGGS
jgi:hypothetical protein